MFDKESFEINKENERKKIIKKLKIIQFYYTNALVLVNFLKISTDRISQKLGELSKVFYFFNIIQLRLFFI